MHSEAETKSWSLCVLQCGWHLSARYCHVHIWSLLSGTCIDYTCKICKPFSRGLRSGEVESRPWEMTYN